MRFLNKQHKESVEFRNKSVIEHIESKDLLSSKSVSKENIHQNHQKHISIFVKADRNNPKVSNTAKFEPELYGMYSDDIKQEMSNEDFEDFYSKRHSNLDSPFYKKVMSNLASGRTTQNSFISQRKVKHEKLSDMVFRNIKAQSVQSIMNKQK